MLHLGLVRLTCEVITGDMDVTALLCPMVETMNFGYSSLAGACVAAADDRLCPDNFCPEVGPCVNKRGGTD